MRFKKIQNTYFENCKLLLKLFNCNFTILRHNIYINFNINFKTSTRPEREVGLVSPQRLVGLVGNSGEIERV